MSLIAVTPTTVYSAIPDPLVSNQVANQNVQCGNESTCDSYLKGAQVNSVITEVVEIKEEPVRTPFPPVTLPVTGQCSSTCIPVEVKTEPNNTEPGQNQDGSTPCHIEFVSVQSNPAFMDFSQRVRICSCQKTVPIEPKSNIDEFGNFVPYEDYAVPTGPGWHRRAVLKKRPVKKKPKCPSNISQLRKEIFPVAQTPVGDMETYQNRQMCPYCCATFSKRNVMVQHFGKFHKNHYLCKKCNYIYESQDILDEHYEFHKKNPLTYKCTKCDTKYKHQWGLEQHYIRKHSTVEPKAVGDEIKEEGGLNCYEESQAKTRSYACSNCDNVYSLQTHLRAHERITHDVEERRTKKFKCPFCTKTYSRESNFHRHVEMHNQRYTCDICGKVYKEKHYMRVHMRKHTGEKPYKCKFCSRKYAGISVLRVHMLTHTGERPYVCNICGKSFTQRSSMMFHHRKHPGNHPPPPPVYLSCLDANLNKL